MASWNDFRDSAPALAAEGWRIFDRGGTAEAFLATVRGTEAPRIHPIYIGAVEGRLYAFVSGRKRSDLERDGRFALHAHQDPASPSEFSLRGRARSVTDSAERAAVAASWSFEPDASYGLFELSLDEAILGTRDGPDAWPPVYSRWRSNAAAASGA